MRIIAPNYTQTPNDLFDHWLPLLGDVELKVLLIIMRKTFGWNKTRDAISISQLVKFTGSNQTNVISAAKSLMSKGLITRSVEGPEGKQVTYYELVVIEDSNNSYPYQDERGVNSNNSYPSHGGRGTPPKLGGTKETNTKETIVCSVAAPLVAASPTEIKKENLQEASNEKPSVKKIEIKTCDGKSFAISEQDLYTTAIQNRLDWKKPEIEDLWKILEKYTQPVRDFVKFCDATIKNIRKSITSKETKEKETKWNRQTQNQKKTNYTTNLNKNHLTEKSQNINVQISTKGTLEQVCPNWREMYGLPSRYSTT